MEIPIGCVIMIGWSVLRRLQKIEKGLSPPPRVIQEEEDSSPPGRIFFDRDQPYRWN